MAANKAHRDLRAYEVAVAISLSIYKEAFCLHGAELMSIYLVGYTNSRHPVPRHAELVTGEDVTSRIEEISW
jgi:hypothetical protein